MQPSELSRIPARHRQHLALLIAPVAVVLLLAGVLLAWRAGSPAGHVAGVLVALCASGLLAVAHGLFWSARADVREQRLDEAILATAGPCGGECGSCDTDCAVKALPRA
ncbi:MAG TPA: hypothetical protein VMB79_14315 [Jatrophihabitans sp.]|nr:hypothetical protein [Jatrophihabitans sp.]